MTLKQEKCGRQCLVKNLEASTKATIEQDIKEKLFIRTYPSRNHRNTNLLSSHIWKTGHQLSPTKIGPKLGLPHRGWKTHILPRRRHYTYRRFNDIQNPMEQRSQHDQSEVYVHKYEKNYLRAPMYRYEYMIMKLTDFPMHVQQKYNLYAHAKNGYVYIEIRGSI